MSKKVIVPSKFFRESVRTIYTNALSDVGVKARDITVHLDSSATVQLKSEADLKKVLTIAGIEQLSDFSKAGNIRVVIPAAVQFLSQNNPTIGTTTKKNSSLNPLTPERRAELDARKEARARLLAMLADHGVITDDPVEDSDDEPEGDDENQI